MMADEPVRQQVDGGVLTLTLNRAAKRNALGREMLDAMIGALRAAADDTRVWAIVVIGAGPAFCAGLDLDELRTSDDLEAAGVDASGVLAEVLDVIANGAKPVIAAVNGPAVAGGAAIVSACDLVVASERAVFGYPGIRRGIVAGVVVAPLVARVGMQVARRLLLTGELIGAAAGRDVGFVDEVVPAAMLAQAAQRWAVPFADLPTGAVTAAKSLVRVHDDASVATGSAGLRGPRFRVFPTESL